MYLEKINSPADVKKLTVDEMTALAEEMRKALLFRLSKHGGHFGPNFGMVEATIAMHYVFESPKDKIVFDVSHQSYPHKILTGRKESYLDADKFDDISGYTNPEESEHDLFTVGHTSTSVSLASGLAKARDLKGEEGNVIAENHGGMYRNLKLLRDTEGKAECNLFKAMGLDYVFVKDGNDIPSLIEAFEGVKDSKKPVVVHIVTQKGKGYAPAEKDKETWHWHMPFDPETGKSLYNSEGEDYGTVTCNYLLEKMQADKSVCAITSATPTVFGFTPDVRKKAGKQFMDVGIAEEHATALASGIAKNGGKPFYGVYSSFLQRTYDQLSQDVCINKSPVTIAVFAASVYGMSDVTHLGIYDIPMISNIPELVYLAPVTKEEYLAMLDWSLEQKEHPVAIRVPASLVSDGKPFTKDLSKLYKYEITQQGSQVAFIALGSFYGLGVEAAKLIEKKTGVKATVINPYYITGIDKEMLESLKADHKIVITLEDGVLEGGFGEKIARFYGDSDVKTLCFGLEKKFYDRYDPAEVLKENHLTPEQIAEDVIKTL
mgnify:CR=1 FL=1